MTRTVLLLENGSGGSALQATRELGRLGWRVLLGSPAPSYAARSRWCAGTVPVGDDLVADVAALCRREPVDAVLPCGDVEQLQLSAGRDAFDAVLPLPPHDVVVRAQDKRELALLATAAGLATPRAQTPVPGRPPGLALPVVVKPASRVGGTRHVPTTWAATADEAVQAAQALAAAGLPGLFQEPVSGPLAAVVVVLGRDGQVLARLQQVADRVFPVGAGDCVRGRSVPVDPALADPVVALLRELGWSGIAQVELLLPDDGGTPVVLDLNGRVYGSMALARAAGLPLAHLALTDALGRRPAPVGDAAAGTTYQAREGDLRRALAERQPSAVGDLLATWRARPTVHQVWDRADPAPLAALTGQLVRRAAGKARRRVAS